MIYKNDEGYSFKTSKKSYVFDKDINDIKNKLNKKGYSVIFNERAIAIYEPFTSLVTGRTKDVFVKARIISHTNQKEEVVNFLKNYL